MFVIPALAASGLAFADVGQPLPPSVGEISVPSDPVEINQLISFTASFTEPGGFPVTAVWDWGDDSQCDTISDPDCTITEPGEFKPGFVSGSHTYTEPGVYTVLLKVTSEGTSDSGVASSPPVVVFDPAGGFVTGGGWINSPSGAYTPDPDLTGKANFTPQTTSFFADLAEETGH